MIPPLLNVHLKQNHLNYIRSTYTTENEVDKGIFCTLQIPAADFTARNKLQTDKVAQKKQHSHSRLE